MIRDIAIINVEDGHVIYYHITLLDVTFDGQVPQAGWDKQKVNERKFVAQIGFCRQ
jgi:hypothetical protein